MRRLAWSLTVLIPFLLSPAGGQVPDQCVACHTDPPKLKALVRPPADVAQEEEGEG